MNTLDTVTDEEIKREYLRRLEVARLITEATAVVTELIWDKVHDKYGRPSIQCDRIHKDAEGHWVKRDRNLAVVVTLPKHVEGPRYLVNVRPTFDQRGRATGQYLGTVTHHATRKAAIAFAEASI